MRNSSLPPIDLKKLQPDARGPYAGDAKLFLANLSYQATKEDIERLFSKYGLVLEVVINCDKQTGRSKGFGFVTMDDARDAADAVRELNKTMIFDRELLIEVAHGDGSASGIIHRPKIQTTPKKRKRDERQSNEGNEVTEAHENDDYDQEREQQEPEPEQEQEEKQEQEEEVVEVEEERDEKKSKSRKRSKEKKSKREKEV